MSFRLSIGEIRCLKKKEKRQTTSTFKYVVLTEFTYEFEDKKIIIPRGFLTDGSTYSPDTGYSWIFHDYLYATHQFSSGQHCDRAEADNVMKQILNSERRDTFKCIFTVLSSLNPFWSFSRPWKTSGKAGVCIYEFDK